MAAPAAIENEAPHLIEPDLGLVEDLAAFGGEGFHEVLSVRHVFGVLFPFPG